MRLCSVRRDCVTAVLLSVLTSAAADSTPWSAVRLQLPQDAPMHRIVFTDDRVGWICAGLKTILRTDDGGTTWAVLPTNLTAPDTEVSAVWFRNHRQGLAVGAVGQRPVVWQTEDGGKNWTSQKIWDRSSAESLGGLLDVCFVDDVHGWAAGFNGGAAMLVATEDGGRHWNVQYSGSEITEQFSRIICEDHLNVWALSPDAVMQTRDGGKSWRLRHFGSGLLNGIDAPAAADVWVAGDWDHLLHSRNAVAWHRVSVGRQPRGQFFGYVKFATKVRGWTWGTKCNIFMTRNGGQTWTSETCPLDPAIAARVTTGEMATSRSKLFMIANPGYLLVRSIE